MWTQRKSLTHHQERATQRLLIVLLCLVGWACADGDGCDAGCDDLLSCDSDGEVGPLSYIYPEDGPRMSRALQVHLTQRGLDFVGDNLEPILVDVAGLEDGLSFCLEPQSQNIGIGNADICGAPAVCDDGTPGCEVEIEIVSFDLVPVPAQPPGPTYLRADIAVRFVRPVRLSVLGSNCAIGGDRVPVSAAVEFTIDPVDNRTRVRLDVDSLDFDISQVQITGGGLCSLANTDAVKNSLGGLIDGQLAGPINDLVGDVTCERCSDARPCPPGSFCDDGICILNGQDTCLGLALGLDGLFDLGGLLSDFAPGLQAELAYSVWLADYVDAVPGGQGQGFDLGGRAGFMSPTPSLCVPFVPAPTANLAKSPELHRALSPNSNPFAVGVGVAREALDLALWGVYQSGVLCLEIGADEVEQLTTSLFGLLLPSLGDLTGGANRAVQLALRPNEPPTVELGRNVVNNGTIEEPLIYVNLNNLDIDFFTQIYDRTTRIFTLNADLRLPVALQPVDNAIEIVLGDITQAFTRVEPRNANLLAAADVSNLANALPTLLGIVVPELTSALEDPIELPEIEGFRLVLREDSITSVDDGAFLAIFADLELASAPINSMSLPVSLQDVRLDVEPPSRAARAAFEAARLEGTADLTTVAPRVTARLQVEGVPSNEVEVSWRINEGIWSRWTAGPEVTVESGLLALDGAHRVAFRARAAGLAATTAPEIVERIVVTDSTPPRVQTRWEGTTLVVNASDALTPADALRFQVQVDGGPWRLLAQDGQGMAHVDLAEVLGRTPTAAINVRVEDEAGNQATSRLWKHREGETSSAPTSGAAGCAAAPGSSPLAGMVMLALMLLGWRRRSLLAVAVAALALSACDDSTSVPPTDTPQACDEDENCPAGERCIDRICVSDLRCSGDGDCPEGQRCESEVCVPGSIEEDTCSSADECTALSCSGDQVAVCTAAGNCACEAPCPDGCGSGTYCCETSRTCEPLPDPCADVTCQPGQEPELQQSPSADGTTCEVTPGTCVCITAPPLPFGFHGLDASTASTADGNLRVVATQNVTYRDLIVGVEVNGGDLEWMFVDGKPGSAQPTGDPEGPRGGIAGQGDDVGRYSSVAVAEDGTLHVAYFARTGPAPRSLRYARGERSGDTWEWSTFTLDETQDAGLSSSVFLGDDGAPIIVYAVPRVDTGGTPAVWVSEMRMAVASSAAPESDADFTIAVAASMEHEAACGGGCTSSNDRCRVSSNRCEVRATARFCDPSCGSGEECFTDAPNTFSCGAIVPAAPYAGMTASIGLHVTGRILDGALQLLHYDGIYGNLLLTTVDLDGGNGETVLLDGEGEDDNGNVIDLGDVGRFPAWLQTPGGRFLVAYHDASEGALRVLDVDAGESIIVDAGDRDTGEVFRVNRVGADPVFFLDGGGAVLLYQDTTTHRIYEARETSPGTWTTPFSIAPEEGAERESLGFFLTAWQDARGAVLFSHRIARSGEPVLRDLRRWALGFQ